MGWDGDVWQDVEMGWGLGGGTWNTRPREAGSAWRVSNGAPIRGFWQVAGAHGTRVGGRAGAREEGVRIGKFLKA